MIVKLNSKLLTWPAGNGKMRAIRSGKGRGSADMADISEKREKRDCGGLIKQISDELRKNANNAMRSQNMTLTQLEALLELERAPEGQRSLKELEKLLHVAQSTAAGVISRLEQKGFVQGLADAGDRRVKLVQITQAGRDCVSQAAQSRERAEEQLLAGLTATERDIFLTLLKKVRDSLN